MTPPTPQAGPLPIEIAPAIRPGSGAMFDAIAVRYDRVNRVLSLGLDGLWRRRLVAALGPLEAGAAVLDVATGTGDVALAAARRHLAITVVGVDPSRGMLDRGRAKVAAAGLASRVELVEGDALSLPFADGQFAATTIAFGIRNVPDRAAALRELVRVTRPGGIVAVLELCEPDGGWFGRLARWHVHHVVPRLGAWLASAPEYRYLQQSIAAFPPPGAFAAAMTKAGLLQVRVLPQTLGVCHVFAGQVPPRQPGVA